MEKNRQIKMMFIVALVLSVTAMTLGFAAFSTTLNISSSASVTPNSDDFKVQIFGINGDNVVPIVYQSTTGSTNGYISDDGMFITGINVVLSKPGDQVSYSFIAKNTGKYDAYIEKFRGTKIGTDGKLFKCTSAVSNGISDDLLEEACNSIHLTYGVYDYETGESMLSYEQQGNGIKISPGESIIVGLTYKYEESGVYADGDFNVEIGDLYIDVTSAYVSKTIPFSMNGKYFQTEEGMTWREWIDSDYNDGSFYSDGSPRYTFDDGCTCTVGNSSYVNDSVLLDDIIEERAYYCLSGSC